MNYTTKPKIIDFKASFQTIKFESVKVIPIQLRTNLITFSHLNVNNRQIVQNTPLNTLQNYCKNYPNCKKRSNQNCTSKSCFVCCKDSLCIHSKGKNCFSTFFLLMVQ